MPRCLRRRRGRPELTALTREAFGEFRFTITPIVRPLDQQIASDVRAPSGGQRGEQERRNETEGGGGHGRGLLRDGGLRFSQSAPGRRADQRGMTGSTMREGRAASWWIVLVATTPGRSSIISFPVLPFGYHLGKLELVTVTRMRCPGWKTLETG